LNFSIYSRVTKVHPADSENGSLGLPKAVAKKNYSSHFQLQPHFCRTQIRRVSRRQYCALYKFIYLLTYPNFFWGGGPKFLNLTYRVAPIFHHLAKFHCVRPSELRDFAFKQIARRYVFKGGPQFWDLYSLSAHTQSCVKVSRRSAETARRCSSANDREKTSVVKLLFCAA